ncbi:endo-type 6-aminohexanoate oligomer hydrolase [uncultured Rubrobacteraceae bacterium]|uniref:Endo-type 6-aminohexanoate oligomer hydrolase n=1 Tax=uncultured Rubrobacteraceae bacterium TaxID=349277 RepID=A0A6J4PXF9_9ACTN|nr:endo-type 6-aminohexanoate oligomer hydrolase [uncultured Rubrobacteraceae bacterium]
MPDNLCDVPGVLVGHATDTEGATGCTAVLFEDPDGAVVGADVRGSSPGTRETDRLGPVGAVRPTHGLLLTGGSAFGLAAADGVVRFLEEKGVGLDVGVARIPLVSAAVLFDVGVGDPSVRPDAAMGYEAASSATTDDFAQGSVGAGAGATVGKVLGMDRAMKGGLGSASVRLEGGLVVGALAAVNAFGEVRDPRTRRVIAGPRLEDGTLGDTVALLSDAAVRLRWGENTTLGIVATNARLSKPQATKVAQMAHDGLARAIYPVHTTVDGDVVFAASTGWGVETVPDVVGAWGARMIEEAIVRAVRAAEGLHGIPAPSEL